MHICNNTKLQGELHIQHACMHPHSDKQAYGAAPCSPLLETIPHSQWLPSQVGFVMRLEGQRLSAALEDFLPDFQFAFEGNGGEVGGMYYHTDRTRQLNAHFGDMLHKIQDLEVSSVCK